MQKIRETGFDRAVEKYIKNGAVYIGGSAGAHIVTEDVSHITSYDPSPEGMTNFKGLGLLDGILICHYSKARKELHDKLVSEGKKVYPLTDDDSIVITE